MKLGVFSSEFISTHCARLGGLARAFAVACTHANLGVAQKIKIVVAKKQFKAH